MFNTIKTLATKALVGVAAVALGVAVGGLVGMAFGTTAGSVVFLALVVPAFYGLMQ